MLRSDGSSSSADAQLLQARGGLVEPPARQHVGEAVGVVGHGVRRGGPARGSRCHRYAGPCPPRGASAPPRTLKRVVLPAPLRPTSPTLSPARTCSEMPSTIVLPPISTVRSCATSIRPVNQLAAPPPIGFRPHTPDQVAACRTLATGSARPPRLPGDAHHHAHEPGTGAGLPGHGPPPDRPATEGGLGRRARRRRPEHPARQRHPGARRPGRGRGARDPGRRAGCVTQPGDVVEPAGRAVRPPRRGPRPVLGDRAAHRRGGVAVVAELDPQGAHRDRDAGRRGRRAGCRRGRVPAGEGRR